MGYGRKEGRKEGREGGENHCQAKIQTYVDLTPKLALQHVEKILGIENPEMWVSIRIMTVIIIKANLM